MKTEKWRIKIGIKTGIIMILSVVILFMLGGCQGQEENAVEDHNENTVGDEREVTVNITSDMYTFPERYEGEFESVSFDMKVQVDADLEDNPLVEATAHLVPVNQEKGMAFYLKEIANNSTYDTYSGEGLNEYGEEAESISYVNSDESYCSMGPYSSQFSYSKSDLLQYIYASVRMEKKYDDYNLNLYSKTENLAFMNQEEAIAYLDQLLIELGVDIEYIPTVYALDYQTMESQEEHIDIEGNLDTEAYKDNWSTEDDCYYISLRQQYRDLPVYHVYSEVFTNIEEMNTSIQAYITADGYEDVSLEKVFTFTEENPIEQMADIETIATTVCAKYNQIISDTTYIFDSATLYYYVDIFSGTKGYQVKPVWILTGVEKDGTSEKEIQVTIDAQTGQEIAL